MNQEITLTADRLKDTFANRTQHGDVLFRYIAKTLVQRRQARARGIEMPVSEAKIVHSMLDVAGVEVDIRDVYQALQ